jgi:TrmH family RNA methyltransferase
VLFISVSNKNNNIDQVSEISKNKIKWIRSLQLKKNRETEGLFLVEGEKMVHEAMVYCKDKIQFIAHTASFESENLVNFEHQLVSEKELEMISSLKTPNKALAVVQITKSRPSIENQLVLALDDIQDPGNMGTILRIADWYGIQSIICSKNTVDCYNPKVVQASMGAIFRIQISYVDLTKWLKSCKSTIYGALLEGENLYQKEHLTSGVLLMGNEGKGISKENCELINQAISIPRYGQAESLNVSVATGIIVSEFVRRQQ